MDLLEVSTIKPLDEEALAASARKTGRVLTVEEHNVFGGLGSAVAEALARHAPARMEFIGVQDTFSESGEYAALMAKYGLSADNIARQARRMVKGVEA